MSSNKNHQRTGISSNSKAGEDFEKIAKAYLEKILKTPLEKDIALELGHLYKNRHRFDFGIKGKRNYIIECKSHRWTQGDNSPSAKLTNWNEAMYCFHLASSKYKKIFFIEKSYNRNADSTLGKHYIHRYKHLIPNGVEIWEFDLETKKHKIIT